jgi:hypothetical protein
MQQISWIDRVRNEVLHRAKEERNEVLRRAKAGRNILNTIKRRKDNWLGHILRRDCFLKHVIEVKVEARIEVMERRRRRRHE